MDENAPLPIDTTTGDTRIAADFKALFKAVKAVGMVLLVAVVGYLLIIVQGQQAQLARRTPTLDYLVCHDRAADDVSIAKADYMVAQGNYFQALVDFGVNETATIEDLLAAERAFEEAGEDLAVVNARLRATTDPDLPLWDGPEDFGEVRRCPAAPIED